MGIEEQRKAEQFYLESDVNGIHTPIQIWCRLTTWIW
jgi:hypothetical protein